MMTPKFVPIVSVTGLVSLVLCGVLAWQVKNAADDATQRDCERAVATRVDGRSMWLYLLATAGADPAKADAFKKALDEKLPPLECRDGHPVPAKP